jgi:hypothetical protein
MTHSELARIFSSSMDSHPSLPDALSLSGRSLLRAPWTVDRGRGAFVADVSDSPGKSANIKKKP